MTKPAAFFRWPRNLTPSYGPYRAVLDRWIDADTGVFLVDMGMGEYVYKTIRLLGYSSPRISTEAGKTATQFANDLAPPGSRVLLHSDVDGNFDPTFTRWVARIELEGGLDYGEILYSVNHAAIGAFES